MKKTGCKFRSKKGKELKLKLMALGTSGGSAAASDPSAQSSLSLSGIGSALDEAVSARDRLVAFDKDKKKRTKVIDDQSDYFADANSAWIGKKERDRLAEKQKQMAEAMEQSRLGRRAKFTIDFAGRKVLEEDLSLKDQFGGQEDEEEDEGDFHSGAGQTGGQTATFIHGDNGEEFPVPRSATHMWQYDPELVANVRKQKKESKDGKQGAEKEQGAKGRVQDSHLQELRDHGDFITVPQPQASLLVRGIRKYEGFKKYTTHRGPLWIASSKRIPTPEDIKTMEAFYRRFYKGELPADFPTDYKTGCVIGRVYVSECLTEEEFSSKADQAGVSECDEPFVLVCENPCEIEVPFPTKAAKAFSSGQEPAFPKLDPQIHKAVKKILQGF